MVAAWWENPGNKEEKEGAIEKEHCKRKKSS
jgi:hypothetical protein